MGYPTKRKLDGAFFRVNRDQQWVNVCWTDLTDEEREHVGEGRSVDWWSGLCKILTDVIIDLDEALKDCDGGDVSAHKALCMSLTSAVRALGDEYDLVAYEGDGQW